MYFEYSRGHYRFNTKLTSFSKINGLFKANRFYHNVWNENLFILATQKKPFCWNI